MQQKLGDTDVILKLNATKEGFYFALSQICYW